MTDIIDFNSNYPLKLSILLNFVKTPKNFSILFEGQPVNVISEYTEHEYSFLPLKEISHASAFLWLSSFHQSLKKNFSVTEIEAILNYILTWNNENLYESSLLEFLDKTKLSTFAYFKNIDKLPIFPIKSFSNLVNVSIVRHLVDLSIIALSSTVESGNIDISVFQSPVSWKNESVKTTTNSFKWLLNDSKLNHQNKLDNHYYEAFQKSILAISQLLDSVNNCVSILTEENKTYLLPNTAAQKNITFPLSLNALINLIINICENGKLSVIRATYISNIRNKNYDEEEILKNAKYPIPAYNELIKLNKSTILSELKGISKNLLSKLLSENQINALEVYKSLIKTSEIYSTCLLIELRESILNLLTYDHENIISKNVNFTSCYRLMGKPLATTLASPQISELKENSILKNSDFLSYSVNPVNQVKRIPKLAKGTKDIDPYDMVVRDVVINKIKDIFQRFGAVSIDTPIFEPKETLMGKYGEDQKLIFDLKDQGGEQLALRYDLTVPLARYITTHNLERLKRLQIGKVYRRDEPQITRGRFREFYQCDFDVVGVYDELITDMEVLMVLIDCLCEFEGVIGSFIVRINHRKLLNSIMEVSKVPFNSFKAICSAIDKLDKVSWETVRNEMVFKKGLSEASADKINEFINMKDKNNELLKVLESNTELMKIEDAKKAISHFKQIYDVLLNTGHAQYCSIDLSLARGLDYYTGLIFEVVLPQRPDVGSIAAGGRYDKLISQFGSRDLPAIGCSIGVERLFKIIEKNIYEVGETEAQKSKSFASHNCSIFVCGIGKETLLYRIKVISMLRKAGFGVDYLYKENARLPRQMQLAQANKIPVLIVLGSDEMTNQTVQIRLLNYSTDQDTKRKPIEQKEVPIATLVQCLKILMKDMLSQHDEAAATILNKPFNKI